MVYSKTEAAYIILRASKRPLHVREILRIALDKKMIKTKGKTPESTLAVDLLLETRRRGKSGLKQRFIKVGPGLWGLV